MLSDKLLPMLRIGGDYNLSMRKPKLSIKTKLRFNYIVFLLTYSLSCYEHEACLFLQIKKFSSINYDKPTKPDNCHRPNHRAYLTHCEKLLVNSSRGFYKNIVFDQILKCPFL